MPQYANGQYMDSECQSSALGWLKHPLQQIRRGNEYSNYGISPASPEMDEWKISALRGQKASGEVEAHGFYRKEDADVLDALQRTYKVSYRFRFGKRVECRLDLGGRVVLVAYEQYEGRVKARKSLTGEGESRNTFIPSARLAKYFLSALEKYERHIEQWDVLKPLFDGDVIDGNGLPEERGLIEGLGREEGLEFAKEFIATNVKRVLAVFGRTLQDNGQYGRFPISRGARLFPPFKQELLSRILVDESQVGQFERDLYEELVPVAKAGGYGGAWGHLDLEGRNLVLSVRSPEKLKKREWKKAIPLTREQRLKK